VISRSSNIGISKVGGSLGRDRLYSVLQNFGFGAVPGSGLPGEVAGSLRPYQRWYAMDAATIPFGQGMSTTTLQLAMAMSAFANKGRLLEPLLVKRVADARGQTVEEALPRVRKQVVPERVARAVTDMLVNVTAEGGTGTEAALEGYQVAGKTGTAQKSDPEHGGYAKDKWVSSFVGFAPANKPRLTIAVVLDEPMIAHQGGAVAAPVFRRVMEASLRHLGVPAERAQNNAVALTRVAPSKPSWPLENVEMPLPRHVGPGETQVPNLVGRPARTALVQARNAMLEVALQGSGVVSAQQPSPGSVVKRGALLSLQLSSTTPELPAPPLASDLAQVVPQPVASDIPAPAAASSRDKLPTPPRRGQDG
jgi:cell division protein FtsI (penicillin-binding protein 3)